MKIFISCLTALSLLIGSNSVFADSGRHYGSRDHRHNHYRPYNNHRSHNHWVGPAVAFGIAGLAIGAATIYRPPVYVSPPPPVQAVPNNGNWFYCGSSGQYYPYVRYCPEGWQEVMPPR